jgi:hypothetical protein
MLPQLKPMMNGIYIKLPVDQDEVKQKLKAFLKKYNSFLSSTKLLKNASNPSAQTIVGGTREDDQSVSASDAVNAIDYCNKVKAEV